MTSMHYHYVSTQSKALYLIWVDMIGGFNHSHNIPNMSFSALWIRFITGLDFLFLENTILYTHLSVSLYREIIVDNKSKRHQKRFRFCVWITGDASTHVLDFLEYFNQYDHTLACSDATYHSFRFLILDIQFYFLPISLIQIYTKDNLVGYINLEFLPLN